MEGFQVEPLFQAPLFQRDTPSLLLGCFTRSPVPEVRLLGCFTRSPVPEVRSAYQLLHIVVTGHHGRISSLS